MAEYAAVSARQKLYEEIQGLLAGGMATMTYQGFAKENIRLHLERVVRPNVRLIVRNRIKSAVYRWRFEKLFR